MKKLIFIFFMLLGWMTGSGQDHSNYVFNFRLPGTSGENFNFSALDDSVAVARREGWHVLVLGYYNVSHFTKKEEYAPIIERFENRDSSIIISFFKEGGGFEYDVNVSSPNAGLDEIIGLQIHNYLSQNQTGFDGQSIINNIAKALSFSKKDNNVYTSSDGCSAGRSSSSIINKLMITTEDAFFMAPSGVPIFIPSGSKVDFISCNLRPQYSGTQYESWQIFGKGMLLNFTIGGNLYVGYSVIKNNKLEHHGFGKKVVLNGKTDFIDYTPTRTYTNGGSVYLGYFSNPCGILNLKEFKHINAKVSTLQNKHGGPAVDVTSLYSNFVCGYKLKIDINGSMTKVEDPNFIGTIESEIKCPPDISIPIEQLNSAISGADYFEYEYNGDVVVYFTKSGIYAQYDEPTSAVPIYMKYDDKNNIWQIINVIQGQFIAELNKLMKAAAIGSAKVAIFSATLATTGGTALIIDIAAAGAMYAIDGDEKALGMDLLLAPLGVAGEAVSMVKDAVKVSGALKDLSKFNDVATAAFQGYAKKLKSAKDFVIRTGDGKWLKWNTIKPDLQAELGADYAKFCDDFVEIARKSGKHLDCLQCVAGSGVINDRSGTRGGCNYRILKAWKLLAKHPQISTDISSIQAVAKLREAGIPDADVIKIIDNIAEIGVKCKSCTNGNLNNKLFHEVLEDIEHGVKTYGTEFNKVLADIKKTNDQFGACEGAIYVADMLRKNSSSFPPGATQFEVSVIHGFIDIKVGNIFYELKNVKDLPPKDFGRQFARDLLDAQGGLTNIKWWFNKRKIDTFTAQNKTDMMNALKSHLDGLTEQQRNLIRQNHNLDSNSSQGIMNSVLDNFDTIFFNKQ
jgi:hypothetical protein